jgi:toxin YoeB
MEIEYTLKAVEDIDFWKKSGQKSIQSKISQLIVSISENPREGIGKPEFLKYDLRGCFSRKIDDKNRIVYTINELENKVVIHSLRGHYEDK